jgi:hypothetical protein
MRRIGRYSVPCGVSVRSRNVSLLSDADRRYAHGDRMSSRLGGGASEACVRAAIVAPLDSVSDPGTMGRASSAPRVHVATTSRTFEGKQELNDRSEGNERQYFTA